MPDKATPTPGTKLITPSDHTLVTIDFQSQMAFATKSIDAVTLRNNAALVSEAAAGFGVSTILTTVAERSFSGPMFEEINRIAKPRIVLAGLWTSVRIVAPALSAIDQGFEVYVIADACGDVSEEAHERAMERIVQAGGQPMTALQYLLELQRDWARMDSYEMTAGIAKRFGGAYGLGIIYAKSMFGAHEA